MCKQFYYQCSLLRQSFADIVLIATWKLWRYFFGYDFWFHILVNSYFTSWFIHAWLIRAWRFPIKWDLLIKELCAIWPQNTYNVSFKKTLAGMIPKKTLWQLWTSWSIKSNRIWKSCDIIIPMNSLLWIWKKWITLIVRHNFCAPEFLSNHPFIFVQISKRVKRCFVWKKLVKQVQSKHFRAHLLVLT